MTNPDAARERPAPQRVAMLFADRSVEATMVQALESAGPRVSRYPGMVALISALGDGLADLAVVQDAGSLLPGCLASLRVRGMSSMTVIAIGEGSLAQITRAYEHGASDYAVLGEHIGVFVNRVCARLSLLRTQARRTSLAAGPCVLDAQQHELRGPAGEFRLTEREHDLARLLFEHAGETVNLRTLAQVVWGRDLSLAKRTIEQHVFMLRHKLRAACGPDGPGLTIKAVNGVGYRLVLAPDERSAGLELPRASLRAPGALGAPHAQRIGRALGA